jgi:hypothetical protein
VEYSARFGTELVWQSVAAKGSAASTASRLVEPRVRGERSVRFLNRFCGTVEVSLREFLRQRGCYFFRWGAKWQCDSI